MSGRSRNEDRLRCLARDRLGLSAPGTAPSRALFARRVLAAFATAAHACPVGGLMWVPGFDRVGSRMGCGAGSALGRSRAVALLCQNPPSDGHLGRW